MYYLPQFRTGSLNVPGGINASQTTGIILLSIPSDVDITKPGILCLTYTDPLNTDNCEWITYTSIDGSNELQGVARGQEGFSAKAHDNQATVAWVVSKSHINNINDYLQAVTTGPKLLRPQITTSIDDSSGNEVIKTPATASAVNDITVTNAATGNAPTISATGDDTNIDLKLSAKGTGHVEIDAKYGAITADTDGATVTFNMATSNLHSVTLGGNRTLAVSNVAVGQAFMLRLLQDATGSRTVTWFSTIKWAGGSAPTLTTTASKADVLGFVCTSSGNYDGFVVGQNL